MGIVIRQSIKGTLSNYLGAFIGFLTTMFVLTKFLRPEEIGLTRVVIDASILLSGFIQLGVSSSAIRFFPIFRNENGKHNGFFFYLLTLPLVGLLVMTPLYLLLKEPITGLFIENSPQFVDYYLWVIPVALFMAYMLVFETYASQLMRIAVPKMVREVFVRLLLVVVYLLFALKLIPQTGLIGGIALVYFLAMLSNLLYLATLTPLSLKVPTGIVTPRLKKEFFNYTSIIMIGAIGGSVITKLDIFMVGSSIGLDSVGVYSIAFYIATIIDIPSRSISSISAPLAAEAMKQADMTGVETIYKKVSVHQLMAGMFVFLVVWINTDNLFALMPNGDLYATGKWVVLFIALSKLVEVTLAFGTTIISYSRFYQWSTYFVFIIAGVTILTNLIFIPLFGITGAAIATFITCLTSYLFQQYIVCVKLKISPFTHTTLRLLLLCAGLVGVNMLIPKIGGPIVDSMIRTTVIVGLGIFAVIRFNFSEEVNRLVGETITKIRGGAKG